MIRPWQFGGAGPIFQLPLNDLGAGAVNTTPDIHGGSGTATFTRATTAYTTLSSGLLAQVNSGVARSTYSTDGSTYLGYLAEGARTNLALWSRDLTNAVWTASNVTVAKTATGADGVSNSASTLTATAGNGTVLQSITDASAKRVTGCYIKRRTGTGVINMTQDNGGTWTAVTVTAGWTAVSIPAATAANPILGFRIVTSGDAIDVDMVMHEVGATMSTPIPTTSASVTRNADVLTYVASGNISSVAGSAYAEAYPGTAVGDVGILLSGSNLVLALLGTAAAAPLGAEFYDGTNNPVTAKTLSLNTLGKVASSWGGTSASVVLNGGTVASSSYNGALAGASITVGGNLFGPMRNVQIRSQQVGAGQLQAMTQ